MYKEREKIAFNIKAELGNKVKNAEDIPMGITFLLGIIVGIFVINYWSFSWWLATILFLVSVLAVFIIMVILKAFIDVCIGVKSATKKRDLVQSRDQLLSVFGDDQASYRDVLRVMLINGVEFMDARALLHTYPLSIPIQSVISELNRLIQLDPSNYQFTMEKMRSDYFLNRKRLLEEEERLAMEAQKDEVQQSAQPIEPPSSMPARSHETSSSLTRDAIERSQAIEKVDLNTASESAIGNLPKINLILAKKIIQKREALGGFETFEQFIKEMNLPENVVNTIKDDVSFSKIKKPKVVKSKGRMVDF